MNTSLPSDPEIIKEYLEILRAIERESQVYNPLPVKVLLDAVQIEIARAYFILIRITGSNAGIKLFFKNEVTVEPNDPDPYETMEQVEYIEIFDEVKFKEYLKQFLGPLDKQPLPSKDLSVPDDQQKIDWPDDFQWKDDNHFDLAGKGEIEFSSQVDNKRKTYFKAMVDAKTYVETRKMSELSGENEQKVQIALNQIRKVKINDKGLNNLLALEPRNDLSKPSAYRLVPYPNKT